MLQIEALELRAAAQTLVRALDWRVQPGQRWALLGRNGAGKSTLLRCLAGVQRPDAGQVLLDGRDLRHVDPARQARLRAFCPAQTHDRFGLGVLHAVMLAQHQADADAALSALRCVDAEHLAQRALPQLSAGERQRVALAQALAQDTQLLLLDEPVSFQDPAHLGLLGALLRGLERRAVVFAAHDLNWVGGAATHGLLLFPDAGWVAGPIGQVLEASHLQRAFGCAWQRVACPGRPDLWMPEGV